MKYCQSTTKDQQLGPKLAQQQCQDDPPLQTSLTEMPPLQIPLTDTPKQYDPTSKVGRVIDQVMNHNSKQQNQEQQNDFNENYTHNSFSQKKLFLQCNNYYSQQINNFGQNSYQNRWQSPQGTQIELFQILNNQLNELKNNNGPKLIMKSIQEKFKQIKTKLEKKKEEFLGDTQNQQTFQYTAQECQQMSRSIQQTSKNKDITIKKLIKCLFPSNQILGDKNRQLLYKLIRSDVAKRIYLNNQVKLKVSCANLLKVYRFRCLNPQLMKRVQHK